MVPLSRSIARLMARPEEAPLITPAAMMPAMNTSLKLTSVPLTVPEKIEPSTRSSMTGRARLNTSDWRLRKNDFSSTALRASSVRQMPGSDAVPPGAMRPDVISPRWLIVRPVRCALMALRLLLLAAVLLDQGEVDVLQSRPVHQQLRELGDPGAAGPCDQGGKNGGGGR